MLDAQSHERIELFTEVGQTKAKQALHSIWQAETLADAEKAFDLFIETYEPKYPKATLCLQKDREELLPFFDFPAKHWQSIRTRILLSRPLPPFATGPSDPGVV